MQKAFYLNTKRYKKNLAFTLPEVLITVGIIGIVAAFLIPIIQAEIFKSQMRSQLKEAQSIISQAFMNVKKESSGADLFKIYTYWSGSAYTETCTMSDDFVDAFGGSLVGDISHYNLNKYSNGSVIAFNFSQVCAPKLPTGVLVLKNGMTMTFYVNWFTPILVIDLNGVKKPNRLGFDVFFFTIDKNNNIKPMLLADTNPAYQCDPVGTGVYNGFNCATWALKDKCPDGSNQGYWDCLPP